MSRIKTLYEDRVLPHLLNLAMGSKDLIPYRERVLHDAEGRVLEVGVGSGLNLPFYGPQVAEIIALEPSDRLAEMSRRAAEKAGLPQPLTLLPDSAEAIPLDDRSVDTVVTTWTLCTIPDAHRALAEMRRVLKPGGRLLFVEHGRALEPQVVKWQNRLNPLWMKIAGGCHLNRAMRDLIEGAGFRLDRIETGYARGPKFAAFMYEGSAAPN